MLTKISLFIVPVLYAILTKILFATCRVRRYGRQHYDGLLLRQQPFVAAFWHYSIFCTMQLIEGREWVAMVSGSADAEYVAKLLNRMGLSTVRGSRGKGGLRALRQMAAFMAAGKKAAIVADGSQGPALRVQAGAIYLASRTGAPILPFAWGADRYWSFHSWDRTVLPKPFARLALFYGEPMYVPAKLRAADLEACRLQLEERLGELYSRAWGCFGVEQH
ncbi:MAG: lysophospholipid acyltransferase family protein [Deltaproteobacteria bacterium]|nr:lysophospholipid acyltransferase family protein [Deltaproteobacteria bacterium]